MAFIFKLYEVFKERQEGKMIVQKEEHIFNHTSIKLILSQQQLACIYTYGLKGASVRIMNLNQ